jgi:hypothetical protein
MQSQARDTYDIFSREKYKMAKITKAKAKKILKHGTVHGKPLTPKAKRFMGARAGGAKRKRGK